MLCQSAPISPRNDAVSEYTGSFPGWLLPMAGKSCNDAERRAEPVSPSSETTSARPQTASTRRFRPHISARPPQQRQTGSGEVGGERPAIEPVRVRDFAQGGKRGHSEPGKTASSGDSAPQSSAGGLRHRHRRATSGSRGELFVSGGGNAPASAPRKATGRPGVTAQPALFLIRLYQRSVSPSLGNVCRFEPTCSHYAYEAIERHGLIRGVWLAIKRLSSCRPYGGSGFDPVPD